MSIQVINVVRNNLFGLFGSPNMCGYRPKVSLGQHTNKLEVIERRKSESAIVFKETTDPARFKEERQHIFANVIWVQEDFGG